MGGNALKRAKTERKNLTDYNRIKTQILLDLKKYLYCNAIIEAPEKESFGDLDILYIADTGIIIYSLIKELFVPIEIVVNGSITSFDYDNFQIDLIKCDSMKEFDSKMFFYAYGDTGCILGKMINFYKLKLGDKGLWIDIKNTIDKNSLGISSNIGKQIILTSNPNEICEFFGLDYNKRLYGFATQNEIFKWISSSKYYIKEIFQVENFTDKKRMQNRTVYQNFMKYIWGNSGIPSEPKPEHPKIQQTVINYFNKQSELDSLVKQAKLYESRKLKYSGKMFIDLGFEVKDISIKKKEFESGIEKIYSIEFNNWLDSANVEQVKAEFNNWLDYANVEKVKE